MEKRLCLLKMPFAANVSSAVANHISTLEFRKSGSETLE